MAVDAALLEVGTDLVLRLYRWRPAGLSIGYFQEAPATVRPDRVVVRRPTGGGAIEHVDELTFSLAGPAGGAPFAGGQRRTYRVVNDVIVRALAAVGVEAAARGAVGRVRRRDEPFLCFERASPFDVVDGGGRKIGGSAQRRRRDRCLIHASILSAPPGLEEALVEAAAAALGARPVPGRLSAPEREAARGFVEEGRFVP